MYLTHIHPQNIPMRGASDRCLVHYGGSANMEEGIRSGRNSFAPVPYSTTGICDCFAGVRLLVSRCCLVPRCRSCSVTGPWVRSRPFLSTGSIRGDVLTRNERSTCRFAWNTDCPSRSVTRETESDAKGAFAVDSLL